MIRPINITAIYKPTSFKSNNNPDIYYREKRTKPLPYTKALGVAGLYGLGTMGIATIFLRGWKNPFALGTLVTGVMLLLNIPDKMNPHK